MFEHYTILQVQDRGAEWRFYMERARGLFISKEILPDAPPVGTRISLSPPGALSPVERLVIGEREIVWPATPGEPGTENGH